MKWEDVVSLNDAFLPVCDIKDENSSYWKQFICHQDFYLLLESTIKMYQKKEKSVWLQGAFGSGKTHATSVIKNLFSLGTKEIKEYVEHSIKEPRLKPTLLSVRDKLKTFPVILKGNYTISDVNTFSYAIQQETIRALKNAGIDEIIDNSYDDMITQIELSATFWHEIIQDSRLIDEVQNTQELMDELREHNDTLLRLCENELVKRKINVITNDIILFLENVSQLVKKYGYNNITLFWDEFTPILEIDRYNDILNQLQNLSENIKHGNVFLFIVAHRTPNKNKILEEDIKKIYDRFELIHYKMEDITTHVLLANSIQKHINYDEVKEYYKKQETFNELTSYVLNQEDATMNITTLFDMLPIHPYSGLVLSLIARQLQSSNRSIFSFLYDEQGFIRFLENDTSSLMDISYLWDYFMAMFDEDEKLRPYVTKFTASREIEKINSNYLPVLKSILLLNILNKIIGGNELKFHNVLKPDKENLEHIFRATKYHNLLDDALEEINKKYIQKDSDGLFLVSSATLPETEVFNERKKLSEETYKSIINVIERKKSSIEENILKPGILRFVEIDIREATLTKHDIKRYADKFKREYSLKIMIFIAKEEHELLSLKNILKDLAKESEEIIYAVVENCFSLERYEKFIDYSARQNVAKRHHHEQEAERNRLQADKLLDRYMIENLKITSITIYHYDELRNGVAINNFSNEINKLAKKIFKYGPDNSIVIRDSHWEWRSNPKQKIAENVIKSFNRYELDKNFTKTAANKHLIDLLKDNKQDFVLDEKFNIKDDNSNHYLVKTLSEISLAIEKKKKSGELNLGKSLKFLIKPPYGLYNNNISQFIISFALKRYEGKFYDLGNGRKIENLLLIDKIAEIFKYFEDQSKGELHVRFGTEEEDKLVKLLEELFSLDDEVGLAQLTFKIKDWIKEAKYPLWIVKYAKENNFLNQCIDLLNKLINAHDEDIKFDDIKEIVSLIEKHSLNTDLKLLLKQNRFETYFDKFIQNLSLGINKQRYPQVYEYIKSNIRANIDSDIAGWNEDRVTRLVLEWRHNEETKQGTEAETNQTGPSNQESQEGPKEKEYEKNEIVIFKNRIKEQDLVAIVLNNIDNDPDLYRVLKKYI